MKKLITLLIILSSLSSFAQLSFIKETDKELFPFLLSNGELMYYSTGNNITIFKNDLSVYKTVNFKTFFPPYDSLCIWPSNSGLESIKTSGVDIYLTDKFINNDDKIEMIFQYNGCNSNGKLTSVAVICNEDGQEINRFENIDGSISFYFLKNLNVNFISSTSYSYKTKIYSIPGNLPCPSSCSQKAAGIAPISQPNEFKKIQVTDFPNPSSEKVTLAYTLPEGVSFGTLRLYTQTGELVKEFKVSSQVDHLELPVSEYNSGTYFYELQAGGSSSGGKKMVVIH